MKMETKLSSSHDYHSHRLASIRDDKVKGLVPYPHKFPMTMQIDDFTKIYGSIKSTETYEITTALTSDKVEHGIPNNVYVSDKKENLIGRISLLRTAGKKLYFMTIKGDGHVVQFLVNLMFYDDKDQFKEIGTNFKIGDIVGGIGHPGRSKTGELSLYATKLVRLTPCLHEIPSSFFGIADNELRARQRYLDLIVNPESRIPFVVRSQVITEIRDYLNKLKFVEVQTPILSSQVGGASAKPFETFHNDLKIPMFMRIAPELYLKQLIVGGFERVYEIGQQFRNESVTYKHNPEFTSLEFYMVGADYHDLMGMCEELVKRLVMVTKGSHKIKYQPHGEEHDIDIDFGPKFPVIDMIKTLEEETKTKFPDNLNTEEARSLLISICEENGVSCPEPKTVARLIDKLTGHFIEPKCVNPTFIINHPRVMSPLAKPHRDNPQLTERFELFICGMEFANAYTELNDPEIQREAFESQMKDRERGDDEAPEIDYGFIRALEYGLPPTGGFGMGIDRMSMLLSNKSSIRDVILFPTLAPVKPLVASFEPSSIH
jgi:lysyl-tRNA synthetase class 2